MNLRELQSQGHWCEVRLLLFRDFGVSVQVCYALEGGATNAKCADVPWSEWATLPAVIDRLAGEVVEAKAK